MLFTQFDWFLISGYPCPPDNNKMASHFVLVTDEQPRTQGITFAHTLVPAGHVTPKILNYQGREGQISNYNASTFQ